MSFDDTIDDDYVDKAYTNINGFILIFAERYVI